MERWHRFLESLDTPGAHMIVLVQLMILLFLANRLGWQSAERFEGEVIGALLMGLKGVSRRG